MVVVVGGSGIGNDGVSEGGGGDVVNSGKLLR